MAGDPTKDGGKTVEELRASLAAAQGERDRALAIAAAKERVIQAQKEIIELTAQHQGSAEPGRSRGAQSEAIPDEPPKEQRVTIEPIEQTVDSAGPFSRSRTGFHWWPKSAAPN
jgi:small-conductance mechanosensitive channel